MLPRVTDGRPILVTGASGFIGGHLVSALRREGHAVRALVRTPQGASAVEALGAQAVIGDLTDPATAGRVAAGVGSVFHLAGKLFVPGSDPAEYERLHVEATSRLFEACI